METNPNKIELTNLESTRLNSLIKSRLEHFDESFKGSMYVRAYVHHREKKTKEIIFACVLQPMVAKKIKNSWSKRCYSEPIRILGGWYEMQKVFRQMTMAHGYDTYAPETRRISTIGVYEALKSFFGGKIDLSDSKYDIEPTFLERYFETHKDVDANRERRMEAINNFDTLKEWKEPEIKEAELMKTIEFINAPRNDL